MEDRSEHNVEGDCGFIQSERKGGWRTRTLLAVHLRVQDVVLDGGDSFVSLNTRRRRANRGGHMPLNECTAAR